MTIATAGNPDPDFEEVVRKYERELYRLLLVQVQDPEVAEDLNQETFLSAYRTYSSRDTTEDLFHWLCRIALGHLKTHWRATRRATGLEEEASE